MLLDQRRRAVAHLDEIGGGEDGEHRDGHDDRIERRVEYAEAHSQRGDDERELADLGECEAALHGHAEVLAGDQHTHRAEEDHSDHHHGGEQEDLPPVGGDHHRVDHHPHGDEKDRAEEVFHRGDDAFHLLGHNSAGEDRAHHEGAELERKTAHHREDRHREAEAHSHDEHRLVVEIAAGAHQEGGEHVDPHHKPYYKEEEEFADGEEEFEALHVAHGER